MYQCYFKSSPSDCNVESSKIAGLRPLPRTRISRPSKGLNLFGDDICPLFVVYYIIKYLVE